MADPHPPVPEDLELKVTLLSAAAKASPAVSAAKSATVVKDLPIFIITTRHSFKQFFFQWLTIKLTLSDRRLSQFSRLSRLWDCTRPGEGARKWRRCR